MRVRRRLGLYVCGTLLLTGSVQGALVTGPWTGGGRASDNGLEAGTVNTASPVVGDGTAENADDEAIDAPIGSHILALVGDKITLTGSVNLIGSTTGTAGAGAPAGAFRFGLFKDDGVAPENDGWLGYYINNESSGTNASITEKPAANTSLYVASGGGGATLISAADPTLQAFLPNNYTFSLVLERTATGLDVTGSMNGPDYSMTVTGSDLSPSPATFTFDRVGFLLAGSLDADQAVFSNIDVTFVPEPGTVGLAGLAVMGLIARRSRR